MVDIMWKRLLPHRNVGLSECVASKDSYQNLLKEGKEATAFYACTSNWCNAHHTQHCIIPQLRVKGPVPYGALHWNWKIGHG
jgi:hypothetical protein